MPKLTVIMLSYNTEKYLSEAIESILNQSFCDFELIIIDDSSTDNCWNIINNYKQKDSRIIALKNKKNLGIAKSINIGLNIARGEYITRMDSDDISLPQRLEKQIIFLDNNKKYGICSVNLSSIDDRGRELSSILFKETNVPLEWLTPWHLPIAGAPSMYRREIITQHSITNNSNYKVAEDYDFLCRITLHTRIFQISEVLYKYRIHTESIYQRNKPLVYKNSIDISRNFAKLLTGANPPACHDYFNISFNLLGRKPEKYNIIEILSWMNKLLMVSKKRWNWSDKEYNFALMDARIRIIKSIVRKLFMYWPPYRKAHIMGEKACQIKFN